MTTFDYSEQIAFAVNCARRRYPLASDQRQRRRISADLRHARMPETGAPCRQVRRHGSIFEGPGIRY